MAASSLRIRCQSRLRQKPAQIRVAAVERDADRHGFAMPKAVLGQLLELVGGPVSEVERAGGSELEGISSAGHVREVQAGRAPDQPFHGLDIAPHEPGCVVLEKIEEGRVADERHLDGFGDTGAPIALRESPEEREVDDHGGRRGEGPEIVLLPERVDSILDSHGGVVLSQHGGWNAHEPEAPMCRGGGIANDVEHGASADGGDIRVPAQPRTVDAGQDLVQHARVGLRRLATIDHERRGSGIEVRVAGAGPLDRVQEVRLRVGDAAVDDEEHPGGRACGPLTEDVPRASGFQARKDRW